MKLKLFSLFIFLFIIYCGDSVTTDSSNTNQNNLSVSENKDSVTCEDWKLNTEISIVNFSGFKEDFYKSLGDYNTYFIDDDDFIDELKRYESIAFTNKFEYAKFKKTSKDSTKEFSTYKKVENIWTISLVAIENFRSSLSTAIWLDIPHSLEENKKLLEELTKAQKLSDEVLNDLLSGSISCTN